MSRENVEVVRSLLEAWNRGDIGAWLGSAHPEVEFRSSGVYPGVDPSYRGHAGLRQLWRVFRDPWESIQVRVDQVREIADQVVSLCTFEGHAREGMTVQREAARTWRFTGDLIVRVDAHAG